MRYYSDYVGLASVYASFALVQVFHSPYLASKKRKLAPSCVSHWTIQKYNFVHKSNRIKIKVTDA